MEIDHEFREKVLVGLSKLEQQGETTISHLQQINGSVRTLFDRVEKSEKALLEHEITCPIKDRVELIQHELITGDHPGSSKVREELEATEKAELERRAKEQTSQKWWKIIQPLILIVATALGTIIITLYMSHIELFKK